MKTLQKNIFGLGLLVALSLPCSLTVVEADAASAVMAVAANSAVKIEVKSGTTLQAALEAKKQDPNMVSNLILKGKLSQDDLKLLKKMATNGNLTHLDLTDVDPNSAFSWCPDESKSGHWAETKGQFGKCVKLEYMATPKGLKDIERGFFFGCTNLRKVVINEGPKTVGRYAFRGCKALTDVTFPASIQYLYGYIIDGDVLPNLSLHFKGKKVIQCLNTASDPYLPLLRAGSLTKMPAHVYVPADAVEAWTNPTVNDVVTPHENIQKLIDQCKQDSSKWNTPVQNWVSDAAAGTIPYLYLVNVSLKRMFSWKTNVEPEVSSVK